MMIPVVDVGGQYNHLIVRCLNELGAESKLISMHSKIEDLNEIDAKGLVMGGGPQRIGSETKKFESLINLIKQAKIPMLGICVTHQLLAIVFDGDAGPAKFPEYGPVRVFVDEENEILRGFGKSFVAWETHNDEVLRLPKNFKILAHSEKCKIQAMKHSTKPIFGVQFHPEVAQTENGDKIFRNFVEICKK